MTAINRSMVKIAIVAADVNASDVAATDYISGEISNYAQTGGNADTESVPVFGGYVDKEKPIEQVEVALEFIPEIGADSTRWNELSYAKDVANTGVYTMASETSTQAGKKAIYFQATDGSTHESICYNNADVTQLEMSHAADDNRTGNITFKFSPTTGDGVSNYMESNKLLVDMPDWTELDNN